MNTSSSFLYIDDDPLSREIMKILLEKMMGFSSVAYFKDSQDFMEQIQALPYPPTVILLDIKLRPFDGFDVLNMLRKNPDYQDITVVAVTANVMAEDVEKMKAHGFDSLISKPIINRIFPELLRKILNGEPVWYIS